jgi:dUTP pyrophosphatase
MLKITKTRDVKTPNRGTAESAGLDFYIPNDFEGPYNLLPGQSVNIASGIKMVIPKGYSGNFFNKSGLGSKGILVGAQIVDSDYRGEVHLNVHNVSEQTLHLKPGMKLVQMIVQKIELVTPQEVTLSSYEALAETERGEGGFGSTGE